MMKLRGRLLPPIANSKIIREKHKTGETSFGSRRSPPGNYLLTPEIPLLQRREPTSHRGVQFRYDQRQLIDQIPNARFKMPSFDIYPDSSTRKVLWTWKKGQS